MSTREHKRIQDWLIVRTAVHTEQPADGIGPAVPLAELGVDSLVALALCGEIEDEWGVVVEPTLVFDHPTIADIARHLHSTMPRSAA